MNDEIKERVGEKVEETVEKAKETVRHPFTIKLARFGFFTKGFLFIVIGFLAMLVAIGSPEGKITAPTGALATIAQLSYGRVILIIFVCGAIGHGVWNILRGVADVDRAGTGWRGISMRVIASGVGFFYLFLAWTAWNIIVAARAAQADEAIPKTLTSLLLALPLGTVLVFLIGLGIIGAGVHECYSGISGKFQNNFRMYELSEKERKTVTWLGFLSFTARALIFALMGYFFIWAAIDYNPNEAVGLDGALHALVQSYYGKTLLFITAAGLICHGILSLYEARVRRIC